MKILITLLLVLNLSLYSTSFSTSVQGFEENRGQLGDTEGNKVKEVIFYTKHKDFGVYITEKGVSYVIYRYEEPPQAAGNNEYLLPHEREPKPKKMHYSRIDIDLVNSSIERSNIEYKDELPGYNNYYLGHCPEGVLYVKSYREVRIKDVYKGIEWIWRYDNRGELHHEFELSEESAPEAIKLKINYSDYEITENGKKLILSTPLGKIEDGFVIGHRSESMIFPVEVSYVENTDGTIGYSVSNWDRSSKLIIDPPLSLTWATFYGGSQQDVGNSITTDASGNLFVTGSTVGGTFPLQNPGGGAYYQGTFGGSVDIFLLKFTNNGVRQWATFYGGDVGDYVSNGSAILADNTGNVIVTGYTGGGTFPLFNPGGGTYYQGTYGGGTYDAFILKFSNAGVMQWATFYGGNQIDFGYSVISDASGNLFITGFTGGGTFPLQNSGGGAYYQGTYAGGSYDVFILKFTGTGVRQHATFYGGDQHDYGYFISADNSGNIFVTGETSSSTFPLQDPGGGAYYQGTFGGVSGSTYDAFILKFTNTGVRQWATFYGGNQSDDGRSITFDASGNVFVTGWTQGGTFPLFDPGGGAYYQGTYGGGIEDVFILRFTNTGVRQWATFYGGNQAEYGYSIKIDNSGNLYITGVTGGGTFPLFNPGGGAYYQGTFGGALFDAFMLKFTNSGERQWATFYGGNTSDGGAFMAIDIAGNLFVTGYTGGGTFPLQNLGGGAYYQGTYGGGSQDAFILKFGDAVVSVTPISNNLAESYKLHQNYPNPFNPVTKISFDIPEEVCVKIIIYDINGKEVSVALDHLLKAGSYEFTFNGKGLNSGIYFYRIEAGKFTDTKKMILLK